MCFNEIKFRVCNEAWGFLRVPYSLNGCCDFACWVCISAQKLNPWVRKMYDVPLSPPSSSSPPLLPMAYFSVCCTTSNKKLFVFLLVFFAFFNNSVGDLFSTAAPEAQFEDECGITFIDARWQSSDIERFLIAACLAAALSLESFWRNFENFLGKFNFGL